MEICNYELIHKVFQYGYIKYPFLMVLFENVLELLPQLEPEFYVILLKDYYKELYLSINPEL